jgi:hypothetical protein
MSILFQHSQQPTQINTVRTTQSVLGYAVPVVMGTAQIQQSLVWMDGFVASKEAAQGGKGGGKGGSFYLYAADVLAALCNGPVLGLGDVWANQSWLGIPTAFETVAIPSGSDPSYTPNNAGTLMLDTGVGMSNSYSDSFNDFGAPSATSLSGSDLAPMTKLSYGSTLTSGTYSVDNSGNYHFSPSDSGKSVTVSYSHNMITQNRSETDLVPSGKTITVGTAGVNGTGNWAVDLGVVYAAGAHEGNALTKVNATPSATGTYQIVNNSPAAGQATYHFATGDVGAEIRITYAVNDATQFQAGQSAMLNYTLFEGTHGQSPWSLLTSTYPGAAIGYSSTALVAYNPMQLGSSAQVSDNRFEVVTPDVYGSGIYDCNPVTCITQVLTNPVWGLGSGSVPFPSSVLDNGASGTWGGASGTAGARQSGSTAWNWFAAQSFFISPLIDQQDSAASVMSKWLEAGMCAAFMSEGLMKLVPYGDTSAAGNGCTWVAPSDFVVALDDTCFIAKEGDDPVKIERSAWQDAMNVVQVQWDNRSNQYAPEITQESDQAAINKYGERREDPQNWDFIHTLNAATFAASMRVKRSVYIRNTYTFTVPFIYSYLEPMDVITISTTSAWAVGLNNISLGVSNLPVRISKVVDDPKNGLEITCEDYPWGTHQPTIYNKGISSADVVANAYADPGDAEVVMFEATDRLTGYKGNQIWIGACGTSANYGSTNVWVSQDGSKYLQVGTITSPARLGTVASTFASGSDPDTTNSLVVTLAENCPPLEAGSTTDADLGTTLCFVDGEIISYSAASVTGQNEYTLDTYIRRGQMGSIISTHGSGGLFLRLDQNIFKYTYDPTWAGKTLYFKFQAVNAFGNNPQPLGSLTAVTFTVPGVNPGTIDASSGLVIPYSADTTQVVQNADFEASKTFSQNGAPPGWAIEGSTVTLSYETSSPYQGSQSLKLVATDRNSGAQTLQQYACVPGEAFKLSAAVKYVSGGMQPRIMLWFANPSGFVSSDVHNISTSTTSWQYVSTTATVPNNATYFYIVTDCAYITSASTTTWEVDAFSLVRIASMEDEVKDGPTRAALTAANASYRPTNPSNPLTAHDDGSSVEIDIASFTMRVAVEVNGGHDVSVNSGVISGLSYATTYHVYYDDPSYAGGAVTYSANTDQAIALDASGRFYVGSILTPVAGGIDTIGNNDGGTGAQSGQTYLLYPTLRADDSTDPVTWYPASFEDSDGNTTSYYDLQAQETVWLGAFPTVVTKWKSLNLKIHSEVVGVEPGGQAFCDYSLQDGADGSWTNIFTVSNGEITTNTGSSGANSGSGTSWANPSNIVASDNYATITALAHGSSSKYAFASAYGFSLPTGSTILGIQVTFDETLTGSSSIQPCTFSAQLFKAGSAVGEVKTVDAQDSATLTLGNNLDLWGTTWSQSDVQNTGFGVGILASAPPSINDWAASTFYSPLDVIIDSNGNLQQLTTPGTTGSSTPSWASTVGTTTSDGTATWTVKKLAASLTWAAHTHYNEGDYVTATVSGTKYLYQLVKTQVPFLVSGNTNAWYWSGSGSAGTSSGAFNKSYPVGDPGTHFANTVSGTGGSRTERPVLSWQNTTSQNTQLANYNGAGETISNTDSGQYENWQAATVGFIHFPAAGTYNFQMTHDDGALIGFGTQVGGGGNVTRVSGTLVAPSESVNNDHTLPTTLTARMGYTILAGQNGSGTHTTNFAISVSQVGDYGVEVDWSNWQHASNFHLAIQDANGVYQNIVPNALNSTETDTTLDVSGASSPTFPAWTTADAPNYPSVTEASGQYKWICRGFATDFSWHASTAFTAAETVILDPNGFGQTAYRPGKSSTTEPTFASTDNSLTTDGSTLIWINNGITSAVATYDFGVRNAIISVTYQDPSSTNSRALTTDTVALPVTQNLSQVQVRYGNAVESGEFHFHECWIEGQTT